MSRVIVVGAGVVGLSCAARLLADGHRVDVIARDLPRETTSAVAAALWYPYRALPLDRVLGWSRTSFDAFARLAAETPESGVTMCPGVGAPVSGFADVVAPVQLALEQEKRVTEQINGLLRIAREENDFAAEQFTQWFIKEQVEEVATMTDLVAIVTRNRDDLEDIEEYVARESGGGDADPTAPRVAGA